VIRVAFQPDGRVARIEPGGTVMTAAQQLGLHLNAPCGGRGVCGNCRIEVLKGAAEPGPAEREHLTADELRAGWRLACQTRLHHDAVVAVPESTAASDQKILTTGVEHAVTLRPRVRKVHVAVPTPSLADPRADADRLLDAARAAGAEAHLSNAAVSDLPGILRQAEVNEPSGVRRFDVTVILHDSCITRVESGDTSGRLYGVAVDVGTTTVVGELFDLRSGAQLAVTSRTNPQTAIGDDVVSRIHHAGSVRGGLRDLQRRIVQCINEIVGELCRRARVRRQDLQELTAAGNTTMNHLLLGIDPSPVAQAPYVAALRAGMHRPARDVGLHLGPGARLYTLPNIAGFVGGDTVAVILATDLGRQSAVRDQPSAISDQHPDFARVRLAVDIGTNGEMVLAYNGSLVACSTAAGPAFEGARITHGMRASAGAIEGVDIAAGNQRSAVSRPQAPSLATGKWLHVQRPGGSGSDVGGSAGPTQADQADLVLTTIDSQPARGLCGTGLIESVAELLRLGVIDSTGRIRPSNEVPGLPPRIAARIVPGAHGCDVILAHAEIAGVPYDVTLTQRDVREVQLAKAAIAAGIHTLLVECGLKADQIDEVCLAGAFGNHIRVADAVRVGLLPNLPAERITFVGNAALSGARMLLLDATLRDEAERLSRATRYLELAGRPDFQSAFAEAMLFPET
jgi:uncharacterized 2Fe-2S/4Fe-4S cluster protein (DUF4445 family)